MTALAAPVALDDPVAAARFTRFTTEGGRQVAESALRVAGMHCAACAVQVEDAVRKLDGVLRIDVNAASQCARVCWDPARTRVSAFVGAIEEAGYLAAPDMALEARELRRREARTMIWRTAVAAFCAMQVMMFAAPAYFARAGELPPDERDLLSRAAWLLTLPVLLFCARPLLEGTWQAMRTRRITMDVPVALGIAVCFGASSVATFDPGGPLGATPYFDSLTMFVAFLLAGRTLELLARHAAARALEDALGAVPAIARRIDAQGREESVDVARLVAGDRVHVAAGEAFAADGRVVEGCTDVDESLLSGESRPVARGRGDDVLAGSLNLSAPVTMRVERVGADTRHDAIVALMREAASQRPAAARAVDRWAGPFLWGVVVLAAAAALAWQWIAPERAAWVAVSVLIVTCPCALSLATPTAVLAATRALARRGVLLRRLDALENLASVRHVFLDKTGTLTTAVPTWVRAVPVEPLADESSHALLQRAAALAAHSRHPLARALAAAQAGREDIEPRWHAVSEAAGAGLQAFDDEGVAWRLGSLAWVRGTEEPASTASHLESATPQAWFGPPGHPKLRLDFDDLPAPGTEAALRAWHAQGVRVTLLSGDTPRRVQALAHRLEVDDAIGAATPERKLHALREAQRAGDRVLMVGDGINDAPVLAQADVSIAMGHGAALARANADAVLVSNRLDDAVAAQALARGAVRVIRQNMAWAVLYNAASVPLALAGLLPPWAAGMGMSVSSLVVVGNSLRLAR